MPTPAQQIRDLVGRDTVLMPGVYDALTARIAARVGFDITFISGYSVSAARLGEPDFGFLTESEMADATRAVTRVSDAPVIVDADTGYGSPVNVLRTVRDFQDAGAAGVFLEDQEWHDRRGIPVPHRPVRRSSSNASSTLPSFDALTVGPAKIAAGNR